MDEAGMDWDWYYERHESDPKEEESPQEQLEREIESFEREEV
jgi:hypothetical protein